MLLPHNNGKLDCETLLGQSANGQWAKKRYDLYVYRPRERRPKLEVF